MASMCRSGWRLEGWHLLPIQCIRITDLSMWQVALQAGSVY